MTQYDEELAFFGIMPDVIGKDHSITLIKVITNKYAIKSAR